MLVCGGQLVFSVLTRRHAAKILKIRIRTILTSDEALERLQIGNGRYAGGRAERPHQDALRRAEVATGQDPFAVVVGCSDSRVPVEVIFDVGVGDLFVVRTAGNLIEDVCIASVEYAIAVLDVRLVVVMGHRRCGAVSSAVEATLEEENGNLVPVEFDLEPGKPRSYVDGLVSKIRPAVYRVLHAPGDLVDNAVQSNVELMVRRLHKRSIIIHEAVTSGKVKVAGAIYDLDSGLVNFL